MKHAAVPAIGAEGPGFGGRQAPRATVPRIEPFTTEAHRVGETTHIFVHGELDCSTVPSLEGRMEDVLQDGGGPVVLDLSALRFMDVSGARLAVRLESRAQLHGVQLSMRGSGPVQRVFQLTGMERYAPRTARR
jgi:anti-sigma B factor antagonist